MVNHFDRQLNLAFGARAHPIRCGILARLFEGEASIAELARPLRVSAPAISKHMRILEEAGRLSRKTEGREHRCRLEPKRMKNAEGWIEQHRTFWNERLDEYLKAFQ